MPSNLGPKNPVEAPTAPAATGSVPQSGNAGCGDIIGGCFVLVAILSVIVWLFVGGGITTLSQMFFGVDPSAPGQRLQMTETFKSKLVEVISQGHQFEQLVANGANDDKLTAALSTLKGNMSVLKDLWVDRFSPNSLADMQNGVQCWYCSLQAARIPGDEDNRKIVLSKQRDLFKEIQYTVENNKFGIKIWYGSGKQYTLTSHYESSYDSIPIQIYDTNGKSISSLGELIRLGDLYFDSGADDAMNFLKKVN